MTQQLSCDSGPGRAAAAMTWQFAALHSAVTGCGPAVCTAGRAGCCWLGSTHLRSQIVSYCLHTPCSVHDERSHTGFAVCI